MKPYLTERNIALFLFVAVLICFSMAHEDSRKMQVVEVAASTTNTQPKQVFAKQVMFKANIKQSSKIKE